MLWVILSVLSCYYWSFVVTKLAGPYALFRKLRAWNKSDLTACPHCAGFWMALAATAWLGWSSDYQPWQLPVLWFGIAGGSSAIHLFDRSK